MPAQILPIPNELVFLSDSEEPVTDSRIVAKFFKKQHKHVLEKINSLDCSDEFASANFSAHVEKVKVGAVNRDSKFYQMTKDGFIFLAMSFTGKKAAVTKEAYIRAFNAMADQLQKNNRSLPNQTMRLPDFYRQHILLTVEKGEIVHRRLLEQSEMVIDRYNLDHYMRDPEVFSIEQLVKSHHSFSARLESFMQAKLK